MSVPISICSYKDLKTKAETALEDEKITLIVIYPELEDLNLPRMKKQGKTHSHINSLRNVSGLFFVSKQQLGVLIHN